MKQHQPIFLVIGILIASLGCAMMIPALYDIGIGNKQWVTFFVSSIFTTFTGVAVFLANRGQPRSLTIKQAFILTTASWVALTAFAAIPFTLSTELNMSYTDAFFESMSGITTTGSTVITGLDKLSHGILLWRGLLQWLGGLGIIVMAIAVLPMLQVGGMQAFRVEGFDTAGNILPRATQISGTLITIYILMTLAALVAYRIAGMPTFDCIVHSMTTVATGGFSTKDASLGAYDKASYEIIAIIFMILGSLPFLLYIKMVKSDHYAIFQDGQVRWFFAILAIVTLLAWMSQSGGGHRVGILEFRDAIFSVVSIMTGTGYATVYYDTWGPFAFTLFFFTMFIGGCAGSTSCGIKIFRFQILYETIKQRVLTFTQPNRIAIPQFNGAALPASVPGAVMSFFFLFFVCFMVIAYLLTLFGLDNLTALASSATALANVGPALGPITGPAGTFQPLPDAAKWILSAGMLLGRLELFAVLVLFSPAFWRD